MLNIDDHVLRHHYISNFMYTAFAQINSNKKIAFDNQILMLRFKNVI